MKDAYCGLCILALYFLYLMVVKGALSVFDCSKVRGFAERCTCDWGWVWFLCDCFAQRCVLSRSRVVLVSAVWLPPC